MRRSQRRRLFNLFALALLAFAIYLTVFHKEEENMLTSQPTGNASIQSQPPAQK